MEWQGSYIIFNTDLSTKRLKDVILEYKFYHFGLVVFSLSFTPYPFFFIYNTCVSWNNEFNFSLVQLSQYQPSEHLYICHTDTAGDTFPVSLVTQVLPLHYLYWSSQSNSLPVNQKLFTVYIVSFIQGLRCELE